MPLARMAKSKFKQDSPVEKEIKEITIQVVLEKHPYERVDTLQITGDYHEVVEYLRCLEKTARSALRSMKEV